MEDGILRIFENGLTAQSVLLFLQAVIAAFIGIWLYGFIDKLIAYWKFRKNPYVFIGAKVVTSFDGINHVYGVIQGVTLSRVILQSDSQMIVAISLKEFMKRTWKLYPGDQ